MQVSLTPFNSYTDGEQVSSVRCGGVWHNPICTSLQSLLGLLQGAASRYHLT